MSWYKTLFMFVCVPGLILTGMMVPAYATQWQDVAGELMSPACPGRTLVNCTSGQSEQLRELIRQKAAQGESKSAIIRYFVDIYGDEILASPPKRGFALAAWLLPVFVLFNGVGLIIVLTLRWTRQRARAESDAVVPSSATTVATAAETDPYRQRLQRELDEMDA